MKSLFESLREAESPASGAPATTATTVSATMKELRESSRLQSFKSRLHESSFRTLGNLADHEVVPGDTPFTQLADRLAGKILAEVQAGKKVIDKGDCEYRFATNEDWDENSDLAREWATLNGEKMLVVKRDKNWGLIPPDLYSLSEFIESRIPVLFKGEEDEQKIEDEYIKKEAQAPKANDRVEIPKPSKTVSETVQRLRSTKALQESERPKFRTITELRAEQADRGAAQEQVVTTQVPEPGVGGKKDGVEVQVDPAMLKEEVDSIMEAFGDTNPTALLIWFPGFLAQRLKMVGAECENTSDSWDEFGTFKEGKVYTSSYKVTPGSGVPLVVNLAVMDCDDHWEIEYEVSYADGDWEQITDKTGDNIISCPKDQLRQALGKIISLLKEVCNKRKEKDDFRDESKKLLDQDKAEKEAQAAEKKATDLAAKAAKAEEKANKAAENEKKLADKMENDPDPKLVDMHKTAKDKADEARQEADRAVAEAQEAKDKAEELRSYIEKVYKSKPEPGALAKALGESCSKILTESRRLRCSGYVPSKLKEEAKTE